MVKVQPCACGNGQTEEWFQYRNGKTFVQLRCPDCGSSTGMVKGLGRAAKIWNRKQKKVVCG